MYFLLLTCVLFCGANSANAFVSRSSPVKNIIGSIANQHFYNKDNHVMSQIFLSPDENGADIANEAINTQTNIEEDDDFMSDFEFVAPVSTQTSSTVPPSPPSSSSSSTNNVLALFSSIFGAALFVVTQNQPSVSGPALLRTMELSSPTVQAAVCNGKSTIIDFYAPWCESCREVAPSVRLVEKQFSDRLNVVTLDATDPRNGDLVSSFHVDGIPHLAFIDSRAKVLTSLVGAVPKEILMRDTTALVQGTDLPVLGMEAPDNPLSSQIAACPVQS